MKPARAIEAGAMIAVPLVLVLGSKFGVLPVSFLEACGFATGAICVWLATKGNVWNWPIGLANNVAFGVLFAEARLFADAGLQAVYFVIGVFGWYQWVMGGPAKSKRQVTATHRHEWVWVGLLVPVVSLALWWVLRANGGAAPAADAATTSLSLAAQYLLSMKRLENWWIWIVADLIYVPLYLERGLPLTALLYAGFLVLCVVGWRRWSREYRGIGETG